MCVGCTILKCFNQYIQFVWLKIKTGWHRLAAVALPRRCLCFPLYFHDVGGCLHQPAPLGTTALGAGLQGPLAGALQGARLTLSVFLHISSLATPGRCVKTHRRHTRLLIHSLIHTQCTQVRAQTGAVPSCYKDSHAEKQKQRAVALVMLRFPCPAAPVPCVCECVRAYVCVQAGASTRSMSSNLPTCVRVQVSR